MTATVYPHIETDASGTAIISGTTTKVIEVVLDYLAHHWDAHEIRRQYPYLHLAQIHAALAYYFDNQSELDQDIERRRQKVDAIRSSREDSKLPDRASDTRFRTHLEESRSERYGKPY